MILYACIQCEFLIVHRDWSDSSLSVCGCLWKIVCWVIEIIYWILYSEFDNTWEQFENSCLIGGWVERIFFEVINDQKKLICDHSLKDLYWPGHRHRDHSDLHEDLVDLRTTFNTDFQIIFSYTLIVVYWHEIVRLSWSSSCR